MYDWLMEKQVGLGVVVGSYQRPAPQHTFPECPILCFLPIGMHFLGLFLPRILKNITHTLIK